MIRYALQEGIRRRGDLHDPDDAHLQSAAQDFGVRLRRIAGWDPFLARL